MKKLFKEIILFGMPVLIALIVIEVSLRHIPNDYAYKSAYLDSHSDEIETLFLGNSHVYFGVNPEFLKSKSFNAAHVSQSLNCDLAILEKYDGRWKKLKTVVLPVDYFSLFISLEQGVEKWRAKNYNIYYDIALDASLASRFEIANGKIREHLGRFKHYYFNGMPGDRHCNDLGWGTEYHSSKNHDLLKSGETAAKRHTHRDDPLFAENKKTLEAIAVFAQKRNIRLILITSPAYESYVENLDQGQLQRTIDAASAVSSRHPNTVYYNLLKDKNYDKVDFYDGDHFNEIGAKKFTYNLGRIIGRETARQKENIATQ